MLDPKEWRYLIYLVTASAGLGFTTLTIVLHRNILFILRELILASTRSSLPPRRKARLLWLLYWICGAVAGTGLIAAGLVTSQSPQAACPISPVSHTQQTATPITMISPTPPPATRVPQQEIKDLFPFYLGSTWTYNYKRVTSTPSKPTSGTFSKRVIMIETGWYDKVRVIHIEQEGDNYFDDCSDDAWEAGSNPMWYVADQYRLYHTCSLSEASGLAMDLYASELPETMPLPDYVAPLFVGRYWADSQDTLASLAPDYHWYVQSQGLVSVPAGEFVGCYRITFYTLPDATIRWVCPGVGLIATEYHHPTGGESYRAELISFQVGAMP